MMFSIIVILPICVTCLIVHGKKTNSKETIINTLTTTKSSCEFLTTKVMMRDGIKITIDYISPPLNKRFPVILELTPYGRGPLSINYRYEGQYWLNLGYIFVIGDCRGTGDSEGQMSFFQNEGKDGYDLIEWISNQTWSNGRIGMRGSSYTGTNQWFIAREQPPHLYCITPSATIGRPMEDIPYLNGAFALNWAIDWIGKRVNIKWPFVTNETHWNPRTWLKHRTIRTLDVYVTGRELSLYREFLDHPTYDDYWRSIDFKLEDFSKIKIPSLSFSGWFDGTLYGTIWRFKQIHHLFSDLNKHFLIVGPYTHGNAPDGGYDFSTGLPMLTVGDISLERNSLLPGLNMTEEFFNWCLKDGPKPVWKPVRFYITGSNRWMTRETFPPPLAHQKSLFLGSNGHANSIYGDGYLQWEYSSISLSDHYLFDPNNPLIISDYEKPLSLPVDMTPLLNRDDILVYTSKPLKKSVTVVGDINVELKISSTAKDTDFIIHLMDVMPDGKSIKLGSRNANQLRTRYRNGYDKEILMISNETYLINIELHEIGHTFLYDHRIRLSITSSFYPWININSNTGYSIGLDTQSPLIANQTIYYHSNEPSRISMMVIDNPIFDS
ncbi:hypothetical protein I4U23_016350 [Adineta vaga]|nr:hypothetical protein I4U23_016350 [Adineta vaga]